MRYGGNETAGHDMPRLILRRKRAVKGSGLFVLDHDLSHSLWCICCIVIFILGGQKTSLLSLSLLFYLKALATPGGAPSNIFESSSISLCCCGLGIYSHL